MMKKNEYIKFTYLLLMLVMPLKAEDDLILIKFKTFDQDGLALPNVSITVSPPASINKKKANAVSGKDGSTSIEIAKSLLLTAGARKEGCYQTSLEIPMALSTGRAVDEAKPLLLKVKKVKNPIPLYAKNLTQEGAGPLVVPEQSQEVGYDLMVGDWVAPHGKGKISDLIFFYESTFISDAEFSRITKVRFSNEKDGLIPFEAPLHKGSVLVSDYEAPEEGYIPQWDQVISRTAKNPNESNRNEERNFYFRVRTKLDKNGEILKANYGKIYGDFMSFAYYLNPTPNDRNVEFDPQSNLFKNLHWKEKVERP